MGKTEKGLIALAYTILLMFVVTLAAGMTTQRAVRGRLKVFFDHQADQIANTFYHNIYTDVIMLEGIRGLWNASGGFDQDSFSAYIKSLSLNLDSQTGVSSFFFLKEKKGVDDKTIYPVEYLEPLAGREDALGLDFATFPERLAAIEYARDNNVLSTTKLTTFMTTGKPGFFFMLPLYTGDVATERTSIRQEKFAGVVGAAFRSESAFKQIYGQGDPYPYIDFHIYQGESSENERLLYDHDQDTNTKEPLFTTTRVVRLHGQAWTIVVEAKSSFALGDSEQRLPVIVFITGLILDLLVGVYFLYRLRKRMLVESLSNS